MKTANGDRVRLVRIPREVLDAVDLDIPEPEPPHVMKEDVFGHMTKVYRYDDPDYQIALRQYKHDLLVSKEERIAQGIILENVTMRTVSLAEFLNASLLETIAVLFLNKGIDIVEEVLYLSTVTQRGIDEAVSRFNPTWNNLAFDKWSITSKVPISGTTYWEHHQAARFCGYTWEQFCALSGYRMSECVALMRIEHKMMHLIRS